MSQPVLRFAPSPNGLLHLGHAASALHNQLQARRLGGKVLLRIEDIDVGRTREEFVAAIEEDLHWIGFEWEGEVRRQSEHFDDYRAAAARLEGMGVLYPCFATRAEIDEVAKVSDAPRDPDGAWVYPGLWRGRSAVAVQEQLARGTPFAMRLDMAAARKLCRERLAQSCADLTSPGGSQSAGLGYVEMAADGEHCERSVDPVVWGDVVIQRKDVPTSYHLSVVLDDTLQGVTHVVRGQDLQPATGVHRLLQVLLDLPEPIYSHHELICGADGRKLAKSNSDTSLRALREAGWSREDVRREVGFGS
ncbi:MAG: tRNA glutamyl-Q(34) synthetase GluQRS [Filomicrobium sp.]